VDGWKNRQLVDQRQYMDHDALMDLPGDLEAMGVQAVELTGGGEPLMHPGIESFLDDMAGRSLSLGLVTHGALVDAEMAHRIAACRWRWARVSIDAGKPETYCRVRRVRETQWHRAWAGVMNLADRRGDGVRVGVGFVVDADNWREVGACISRARDAGADNVRVSMAFTPYGLHRFTELPEMLDSIAEQVAEQRERGGIDIYDLVTERAGNIAAGAQDYALCAWKEVGCVIGADLNIYACCSWAFNAAGLVTDFRERPFSEAWGSPEARAWRRRHDAREACPITCLYERRNKRAIELLDMGASRREDLRRHQSPPTHVEFI
jgi:MoaA/NifB/PqqE/SkfB family radical SAM enzyme